MIGSRFYFAGVASILATACVCGPEPQAQAPRPCNVVAPSLVDQGEVVGLGRALVTGNTFSGDLDIGGFVTDVVQITNLTRCPVRVEKWDGVGANSGPQAVEIGPGEVFTGNMWVPWGDSGDSDRRMQILISGQPYFRIWQKGSRVAFRTAAELERLRPTGRLRDEADSAPAVPGEANTGGRRHLFIAMTSDGRPYFKVEAIQRR